MVQKNKLIITISLLLIGCAPNYSIPVPGYYLDQAKKKPTSYTCKLVEDDTYGRKYPFQRGRYFFDEDISIAKKACQNAAKKVQGKFRCRDYLNYDVYDHGFSGTNWGARLYDKCIADDNDHCYSKSYQFADCIAAKCNYKGKEITFQEDYSSETWISQEDWSACWFRSVYQN